MEEEQNSETSPPTPSFNVYPGCGGTGWTRPIDANFENWWSGGNSDECEQCHKCSEEHKCDASLTKQLLLRLHMKDSMLCSSAVQHLVIRIRSVISTCSVAVWQTARKATLLVSLMQKAKINKLYICIHSHDCWKQSQGSCIKEKYSMTRDSLIDSSVELIHTYVNRVRGRLDDVTVMLHWRCTS